MIGDNFFSIVEYSDGYGQNGTSYSGGGGSAGAARYQSGAFNLPIIGGNQRKDVCGNWCKCE